MSEEKDKSVKVRDFENRDLAVQQWRRFSWHIDSGHDVYVEKARRNFRFWHGDGHQWNDDDRAVYENVQKRKCFERNLIYPAINTAVGEQINSRTVPSLKPKGKGATKEIAEVLSKLVRHDLERCEYQQKEKHVYRDGMIKRRGYFDIRMDYSENDQGEVSITNLDPELVMPDIFSNSYDPKQWREVLVCYWLTLDEIEGEYGTDARERVEATAESGYEGAPSEEFSSQTSLDSSWGFSDSPGNMLYISADDNVDGDKRYRVLDRQFYRWSDTQCYHDPQTGEYYPVPESEKDSAGEIAASLGYHIRQHMMKRIFWRVTTQHAVLFDDWSPYNSFTVVPYFYHFDYGKTLSLVDNLISMQEMENKALSSGIHILANTANSGWYTPDGSLKNMTPEELAEEGMKNGINIVYDPQIGPPKKITPNPFPPAMGALIGMGSQFVYEISGMSATEQGQRSAETSGVAIQSKQFQAKLQLADGLDNLAVTRRMVVRKLIELYRDFFHEERVFIVAGKDATGKPAEEEIAINKVDAATGAILNDITVGEYLVTVSQQPLTATWEEGQFKQALEMRQLAGVAIPDDELVRLSNLENKDEIANRLAPPDNSSANEAQQAMMQLQMEKLSKEIEFLNARISKEIAGATNTNVQAMFGATNAAMNIAANSTVANSADGLLQSAGFKDANEAPIIPQDQVPVDTGFVPRKNTSPNYPPQVDSGYLNGVEGGR